MFAETNIVLALSSKLQQNAFSIIRYAFTEVLNNAIEHWQSETSVLSVTLSGYTAEFSIRSHAIALRFLNDRNDLETGEIPWLHGTEVAFSISRRTKRRL